MKTKTLIHPIAVNGESYITFEIKLPSHVEKITGVTLTNSVCNTGFTSAIGILSLQTNEESDLVLQTNIYQTGKGFSEMSLPNMAFLGADSEAAWFTGMRPKKLMLNVDGRTGTISGWYKPIYTGVPYTVTIYLEYELMEEKKEETQE